MRSLLKPFSFFLLVLFFCSTAKALEQSTSFISLDSLPVVKKSDLVTRKDVKPLEEVEASVDIEKWKAHLIECMQAIVDTAAVRGMPPGDYAVQVRFLIEKDGSISDVKALNDPGFGVGKACEWAIRTAPKWNAGEVNGKKVRSYHTQPLNITISKDDEEDD